MSKDISVTRLHKAFTISSKVPAAKHSEHYYVAGSGLVYVPADRLNEIPRVIVEHHQRDLERIRLHASVRRVY